MGRTYETERKRERIKQNGWFTRSHNTTATHTYLHTCARALQCFCELAATVPCLALPYLVAPRLLFLPACRVPLCLTASLSTGTIHRSVLSGRLGPRLPSSKRAVAARGGTGAGMGRGCCDMDTCGGCDAVTPLEMIRLYRKVGRKGVKA